LSRNTNYKMALNCESAAHTLGVCVIPRARDAGASECGSLLPLSPGRLADRGLEHSGHAGASKLGRGKRQQAAALQSSAPLSGHSFQTLPNEKGYAPFIVALHWACLALCGVFLVGCRLDMHVQPKYKPLDPSSLFGDGRSVRPEVPGTVAHGHLRTDELLYSGKVNGEPADLFPFPIGGVIDTTSTVRPVTTIQAAEGD